MVRQRDPLLGHVFLLNHLATSYRDYDKVLDLRFDQPSRYNQGATSITRGAQVVSVAVSPYT